ncbi:transposase [Colletotrichum tofieldiae]|uniref:Transposase n=1 Tax=Colletotrichum tofieldiae TaxID=708197 RepID=A0A161VYY3_9PEZI|nr:transposase [Colletotrichum tofieldiae]
MDEPGILECNGSNGLALRFFGTRLVEEKQPGSRAWCISAEDNRLPLLFVYKGRLVQKASFPLYLSPYLGWEFTANTLVELNS